MARVTSFVLLLATFVPLAQAQALAFPAEALGISFGAPIASAQAACAVAGGDWRVVGALHRCSVPPASIGHPGVATAGACDDGISVCSVSFSMSGTDEVVAAWADLVGALSTRYGSPGHRDEGRARCAADFRAGPSPRSLRCILSGGTTVQSRWSIGGGVIVLSLERGTESLSDRAVLNLMYLSPRLAAESTARRAPPPDTRSL